MRRLISYYFSHKLCIDTNKNVSSSCLCMCVHVHLAIVVNAQTTNVIRLSALSNQIKYITHICVGIYSEWVLYLLPLQLFEIGINVFIHLCHICLFFFFFWLSTEFVTHVMFEIFTYFDKNKVHFIY
jgi:hypothetical protein